MSRDNEAETAQVSIVDAATGIFLRYGYKKTEMAHIARTVGISRKGLYLPLPNKGAVFKAIVVLLFRINKPTQAGQMLADLAGCRIEAPSGRL